MSSGDEDDTSALDDDWDIDPAPKTEATEAAPQPAVPEERPPEPPPEPPPPPAGGADARDRSPAWAYRAAVTAVTLGLLGASVSAARLLARREAPDPVATSRPAAPAASTIEAAEAPVPTATATAQPTATASSEPAPEPAPPPEPEKGSPPSASSWQRFNPRTARLALNALAPTLTDCRIQGGRSGKVEVVFEPDGHISSAKPLDAYVGTYGGKCVAKHLKNATVPPFSGEPATFTYAFVIPE